MEAVRCSHSVVLGDNGHPDAEEMFHQVFDTSWMEDSDERYIDFKDTVILLASNVGTDLVVSLWKDPVLRPEPKALACAMRSRCGSLSPALVGRLVVVPCYRLPEEILGASVRLPRGRISLARESQSAFHVRRCVGQTGRLSLHQGGEWRRMIDALVTNTLLPRTSEEYLTRILGASALCVKLGDFSFEFA